MGFVDTVERAILDGLLQNPQWAGYPQLWIGLSSTTPAGDGSNVTEPSGGNYARVSTTATDWAQATGTAPAEKLNTSTVTFPTANATWESGANMTNFFLADATSGGNVVGSGAVATPKPVMVGDTASFAPGDLVLRLGAPGDFA